MLPSTIVVFMWWCGGKVRYDVITHRGLNAAGLWTMGKEWQNIWRLEWECQGYTHTYRVWKVLWWWVVGYNMVYDTRYSLAQLRYGGWWAGWEIGRGGKAGIWVAHACSNVRASRGQVNVRVFGNKIINQNAIHTHQEGGGVISNKFCYLLLSDII